MMEETNNFRKKIPMYNNFKIFKHRTSDMLHLELAGNFDANSAAELITIFEANRYGIDGISVDTNGLEKIHPDGRDTIRENLTKINSIEAYVIFFGDNLSQFSS